VIIQLLVRVRFCMYVVLWCMGIGSYLRRIPCTAL